MNGWTSLQEVGGARKRRERIMRTKHMDQHLNSRLPTLGCPRVATGSKVPEDAEISQGFRPLQRIKIYAQAANPIPHQGTLVSSYQMPNCNGESGGGFWRKWPGRVMPSLPLSMVFCAGIPRRFRMPVQELPEPPAWLCTALNPPSFTSQQSCSVGQHSSVSSVSREHSNVMQRF